MPTSSGMKYWERIEREREELIAALDQMTAWARHVDAQGARATLLRKQIEAADALLARVNTPNQGDSNG